LRILTVQRIALLFFLLGQVLFVVEIRLAALVRTAQIVILHNNFIRCEVSRRTHFFPVPSAGYSRFSLMHFDNRTPKPRYAVLTPDTLPPCCGFRLQPTHHSSGGSRCHPVLEVPSQPMVGG